MELKKESGKIMQDLGVGAAPDSDTRNRQGMMDYFQLKTKISWKLKKFHLETHRESLSVFFYL